MAVLYIFRVQGISEVRSVCRTRCWIQCWRMLAHRNLSHMFLLELTWKSSKKEPDS